MPLRRLAQNDDIPARCREVVPPLREIASGHFAACHFSEEMGNEKAQ